MSLGPVSYISHSTWATYKDPVSERKKKKKEEEEKEEGGRREKEEVARL